MHVNLQTWGAWPLTPALALASNREDTRPPASRPVSRHTDRSAARCPQVLYCEVSGSEPDSFRGGRSTASIHSQRCTSVRHTYDSDYQVWWAATAKRLAFRSKSGLNLDGIMWSYILYAYSLLHPRRLWNKAFYPPLAVEYNNKKDNQWSEIKKSFSSKLLKRRYWLMLLPETTMSL